MTDFQAQLKSIEQDIFVGTDRIRTRLVSGADLSGETSDTKRWLEQSLLDRLTVAVISERCGRNGFESDGTDLDESRSEALPVCSEAAASILALLLDRSQTRLVDEALALLITAKCRVPHILLPHLLDYGAKYTHNQASVLAVGGKRASWLAALNLTWKTAFGTSELLNEGDETDFDLLRIKWNHGTRKERRAILQHLRRSNSAAARELVEATWAEEAAAAREDILTQMKIGLTVDDEQFLEISLSDRSSGVRAKAVDLLATLPQSRITKLSTELVDQLLTFEKDTRGLPIVTLNLIQQYDENWKIYAIEQRSWIDGIGDLSWMTIQWIGMVPLLHWQERFQLSPQELIECATKSEHEDLLLLAWSRSAKRTGDDRWRFALLSYWAYRRDGRTSITSFLPTVNELNTLAEPFLLTLLNSDVELLHDSHVVVPHLLAYERAWSDDLSIRVLRCLARMIAEIVPGRAGSWYSEPLLAEAALRANPSVIDEFSKLLPAEGNIPIRWQKAVQSFYSTLSLRSEMLKEIHR